MSLLIKNLTYIHSDREPLFQGLDLSLVSGEKAALIGDNGSGKSTFLRILAGETTAAEGSFRCEGTLYYVPQHFGQYGDITIAAALGIEEKLNALHAILEGDASEENFARLEDDWTIEDRALLALSQWDLSAFSLNQKLAPLSGGEKTKVFLAGIELHQPEVILLDEPSNHLDRAGREQLYRLIRESRATLLVVSHDRTLLDQLGLMLELSFDEIRYFPGNYSYYKQERDKELNALSEQLEEKEKALRQAKKLAREALERQAKHDSRGKKQSAKQGIPKIVMGGLKNKAENSTARLQDVHQEKTARIAQQLSEVKSRIPAAKDLKLNIEDADLHSGKLLVEAHELNFSYSDESGLLWPTPLNFQIRSGERLSLRGDNGSGKSTLVKLILGELTPTCGEIRRADLQSLFIDQEYSILDNSLSLYDQLQEFNNRALPEHELKILLSRFLFPNGTWDKPIRTLSGGEKMRLLLCCLQVKNNTPDLFILDEPTNNLDIRSLEVLSSTLQSYRGTLLVISHDDYFLREIGVNGQLSIVN